MLWGDRVLWVLWGYGVMGLYGVLGGCVLVGPKGSRGAVELRVL